jgi:predicted nucleic acid-binding protein
MTPKATVYLETTIPSFLTGRPSNNLVLAGQQQLTRRRWSTRKRHYRLFISELVIEEAGKGDSQAARKRIDSIKNLPLLEIDDEAIDLGARILKTGVIPQKAAADAGHIAVAARHGIDYLLTWNCKHIANAEIIRRLDQMIRDAGFLAPTICTCAKFPQGGCGVPPQAVREVSLAFVALAKQARLPSSSPPVDDFPAQS